MTDTYDWTAIRQDAIERFRGELPHAQTEDEIIEVFEQRPSVVLRAIDEVAEAVANGKARSGWAVLRSRIHGALEPARDVTVYGNEREQAVQLAELWIHNAGQHFDRPDEVYDYLFGEDGKLRAWNQDGALSTRLLGLWSEVRPGGIELERSSVDRLGRYKADLERAEQLLRERAGTFEGFVQPKQASPVVERPARDEMVDDWAAA